jgi:uncharacterized protein (DUF1786 family)
VKILTADIGTGTQDIFLYDSHLDMENGFKLILPSPTMHIYRQVQQATRDRNPIMLNGVTMGGGPSAWAVESHLKAGLPVYATLRAAKTLNDNIGKLTDMGIIIVSDEEGAALPDTVLRLMFKDFDFEAITTVFTNFGISLHDLAAVAVAVFDHGEAPPNVSNRKFRFDYLESRILKRSDLRSFAFLPNQVLPSMTRLKAVLESTKSLDLPLVVMDSAPAAILGATFDPRVYEKPNKLIANIGNFHTLAFRLSSSGIDGVFEHHTGFLNPQKLETLILSLADGSLQNETVYSDQGHGALIYDQTPFSIDKDEFNLIVTGPRRSMLSPTRIGTSSRLRPYFAAPFGDMMITGCFGLLAAVADLIPNLADPIIISLQENLPTDIAPWEIS